MSNTSKDSLLMNVFRRLRFAIVLVEATKFGQHAWRSLKKSCAAQRELKRPERMATPLFSFPCKKFAISND